MYVIFTFILTIVLFIYMWLMLNFFANGGGFTFTLLSLAKVACDYIGDIVEHLQRLSASTLLSQELS